MGLDTTHDCWHGAYSAFTHWRHRLAKLAGYEVCDLIGANGQRWPAVLVDWGHLGGNLMGHWDETPRDPLLVLIAHSDCDGVIHPAQAEPLAERLEELMKLIPANEEYSGHIGNMREKTQRFIDGLRAAAQVNQDVEFH